MNHSKTPLFNDNSTSHTKPNLYLRTWYGSRFAVILQSVLIGLAAGFVISAFRLLLEHGEVIRVHIYTLLKSLPWYWTALWALALAVLGLLLGLSIKYFPMIKGSGIPQIEGTLNGKMTLNWAPELPLKFITGVLGLGAGLSLGREGPSIQIAVYTGMAVLTLFKRHYKERRFLMTAAAGAGLSAAFNAPLAGVIFVLEELHAGFAPLFIACAMAASMTANAVTGMFFGVKPIFDFQEITPLPLEHIPWIVLLGVICGILGDIFKRGLYLSQDFFQKCHIPIILRPVLPLLVSIPLGFFLFDVTGGGHNLIESIGHANRPIVELSILLIVNLIFTVFCYGSGTSGGIFFPLLTCGALAGGIFSELLRMGGFITPSQNLHYMIFGMAGFFAAIVKAPVTGAVLIFEMSGNFNYLGNLVLLSLSAFVTTEIMASRPVYEVLLERMLAGAASTSAGHKKSPKGQPKKD